MSDYQDKDELEKLLSNTLLKADHVAKTDLEGKFTATSLNGKYTYVVNTSLGDQKVLLVGDCSSDQGGQLEITNESSKTAVYKGW